MNIHLTANQEKVVEHGEGALLVVAGPGSGKTRVLTERVRRLLAEPDAHFRILALTFTNKAANEMIERLVDVPGVNERAFIGTLHSFCMEVLANRGKAVGIVGLPHIFESYQDRRQVLVEAVAECPELNNELALCPTVRLRNDKLGSWIGMISEAKNNLLLPEAMADEEERRIYEAYNAGLKKSNAVDFDDLLLLTYRLFEEYPKIANFYCRQYRYICIDEAQDLNEAQYGVLRALCGCDYRNVMMVGDPKQAIFVWNGADPKYMDLFKRDFQATTIELRENFRSSKVVVKAAKALDNSYRVDEQIQLHGELVIKGLPNEKEEAAYIVNEIERLTCEGHPDVEGAITPDRCAVLGRNRYVFQALEDTLNGKGIVYYKKLSGAPLESGSDLIEDFELALRLLANPSDRLHLAMLIRRWDISEDIGDTTDLTSLRNGAEILEALTMASPKNDHEAVWQAVQALEWNPDDIKLNKALDWIEKYATSLPDEARAGILQDTGEWRKHWDYYVRNESGGYHSVPSFLAQIALGSTQQPRQDGLGLLTVHSAKGMEFDIVFIIGMSEGTFPDYRAVGAGIVEETRNAYVAVTRSKRLLYLTYPRLKMMPWGDWKAQRPSRYLEIVKASQ